MGDALQPRCGQSAIFVASQTLVATLQTGMHILHGVMAAVLRHDEMCVCVVKCSFHLGSFINCLSHFCHMDVARPGCLGVTHPNCTENL